jgi:hypothetical protein
MMWQKRSVHIRIKCGFSLSTTNYPRYFFVFDKLLVDTSPDAFGSSQKLSSAYRGQATRSDGPMLRILDEARGLAGEQIRYG